MLLAEVEILQLKCIANKSQQIMADAVKVLRWYTHIAGTYVRGLYSHIEIVLGKQSMLET